MTVARTRRQRGRSRLKTSLGISETETIIACYNGVRGRLRSREARRWEVSLKPGEDRDVRGRGSSQAPRHSVWAQKPRMPVKPLTSSCSSCSSWRSSWCSSWHRGPGRGGGWRTRPSSSEPRRRRVVAPRVAGQGKKRGSGPGAGEHRPLTVPETPAGHGPCPTAHVTWECP